MQTVYAYRDDGWMSRRTRWRPRRVLCTELADHSDKPGVTYVVKFRQGRVGTAALISELVCTKLLAAGGVLVLDPRLVHVSREFAASYVTKAEIPYTIEVGLHFGTVLLSAVEDGPPPNVEVVAEPQDVVDIWAFDSWFCNIDRNNHGNLLLSGGEHGRFRLIAADQSDCFCGAGYFADGSWRKKFETSRPAETVQFWQAAIVNAGGVAALQSAVAKVRAASSRVDEAIAAVPPAWWKLAGVDPRLIKGALDARLRRLPDILRIEQWEGLDDVIKDGHLF